MQNIEKGQWVLVDWKDAASSGWSWIDVDDAEDIGELVASKSAGLVVGLTKEKLVLAQNFNGKEVSDLMTIPRGWITGVRLLG